MIKIVHARWVRDYVVALAFSDGSEGEYDFASTLAMDSPLTQSLRDVVVFRRFFLELGALCWSNGLEFSADKLYTELMASHRLHQAVRAA